MGKEIATHVRFNLSAHNMTCGRHVIVCSGVNQSQNEIDNSAGDNEFWRKGSNVRFGSSCNFSRDKWENDLNHRCKRRTKQIKEENSFVFFVIGQKSKKQIALFLLVFLHFQDFLVLKYLLIY